MWWRLGYNRNLLIAVLIIAISTSAGLGQQAPLKSIIRGTGEVSDTFIPPPSAFEPGTERSSNIVITYSSDFPTQAMAPLEYAVDIWSFYLQSEITIWIEANWGFQADNVLASAGPVTIHENFPGAPLNNRYYPAPLANALAVSDLTPGTPDISITFGDDISWYYGTNGNPYNSSYDFVTVALHEIGHGLGFIGSANHDGNSGYIGWNGTPYIWDTFIINSSGTHAINLPNGSTALGNFLTSDDLWWDGESNARIFAPSSWNGGSSFSHLKENTYGSGGINSLMTPYINNGEAIHDPGPIALSMLEEMGWVVEEEECIISDAYSGLQLPCNPNTDTYTQQVVVEYSGNPSLGLLNVNGTNHSILSSPQTVTLVSQPANGLPTDITVYFTNQPDCIATFEDAYVAINPCSCPSDVNSNGGIDAGDILALLASFGCTNSCGPSDVNGDGAVSVEDVLLVLSSFGEGC